MLRHDLKVPIPFDENLTVATDELVASLTAELKAQKESVQPSQLKYLESKGSVPYPPI